jgi:hypothetical protein
MLINGFLGCGGLLLTGDRKVIFFSLSLKFVPNGTIYKNPAVVSEAFRVADPVAIAENCTGSDGKGGIGQGAEQLILRQQWTGGR